LSHQQPFLLVLAGPNGSGKSTLTDYLMEAGVDFGEYINPDVIAAALDAPEPQTGSGDCRLSSRPLSQQWHQLQLRDSNVSSQ
jgi:predicted ABC-type ATPase